MFKGIYKKDVHLEVVQEDIKQMFNLTSSNCMIGTHKKIPSIVIGTHKPKL